MILVAQLDQLVNDWSVTLGIFNEEGDAVMTDVSLELGDIVIRRIGSLFNGLGEVLINNFVAHRR